jgi:hypothetical protein
MGRRNTNPESTRRSQRLNSFLSADPKETPSCLGLNEYSLGRFRFVENYWGQRISRVLHRPFEPARAKRIAAMN